jgi:hypothetical protein
VARAPVAGGPAYRVRVTMSADGGPGSAHSFTTWMSPALRLVRGSEGTWMTLPAATLAALRRVAGDIRPYPAARLPLDRPSAASGGSLPPRIYAPARQGAPAGGPARGAGWMVGGASAIAALAALAGAGLLVVRRRRGDPPGQPAPVT